MAQKAKTQLDQIDKEILRLKYTNRKLTLEQIGKLLPNPMTAQSVHKRMNRDHFQEYWDRLEKDVIWQIKEAQTEAMRVILQTMRTNDPKLKFQAAKTIIEPVLANCPQLLPDMISQEELEWDLSDTEE